MVWYKFSPGHSYPPAQQGYELVEGGQEARVSDEPEWACIGRLPATLARAARKLGITSIQSLWRNVLPVIALLLSASIFMVVFVGALRYIKICDLYRPSYRKIPPVSQAQIDAATSRHLTNEQCVELYPGLFDEADQTAQYWQHKGGVSFSQVERAADRGQVARVLIRDNEMYVKRFEHGWHSRIRSALALINDAILTSVEPIPNIEFALHTGDWGDIGEALPIFALDRRPSENWLWLMPDYGFNSWPEPRIGSYTEALRKAAEWDAKMPWRDKIPQLFWKGAFMSDVRKKLAELAEPYSWAAIESVDWGNKATIMSMDEHCKYKFLGHAEGNAYSGRLKYLLACKSVVIAHEMDYLQHFHHLINSTMGSPDQNLVVIPGREWDDLPKIMGNLLENDKFSEELANRQYQFWQHYISKKSIDCYWRYLFRKWSEVQRFKPTLNYSDTPYVSFNLMGKTAWDPY